MEALPPSHSLALGNLQPEGVAKGRDMHRGHTSGISRFNSSGREAGLFSCPGGRGGAAGVGLEREGIIWRQAGHKEGVQAEDLVCSLAESVHPNKVRGWGEATRSSGNHEACKPNSQRHGDGGMDGGREFWGSSGVWHGCQGDS